MDGTRFGAEIADGQKVIHWRGLTIVRIPQIEDRVYLMPDINDREDLRAVIYVWELNNPDDPARLKGTVSRETVSNVEIWAECFGNDPMNMKAQDSYAIAAMMVKIEGWERKGLRQRIPIYGMQRLYVRDHTGMEAPACDSVTTVTSTLNDLFDFLS